MSLVAATTDLLGGHGPINTDELDMLRRENLTSQHVRFVELFGFKPLLFRQGLAWRERMILPKPG